MMSAASGRGIEIKIIRLRGKDMTTETQVRCNSNLYFARGQQKRRSAICCHQGNACKQNKRTKQERLRNGAH